MTKTELRHPIRRGCHGRRLATGRPAPPTAVSEKSRLAHAVRFLHHTSRFTAASVRHADATMDQMTVTLLMAGPVAGGE
jgi:hypothetical protein